VTAPVAGRRDAPHRGAEASGKGAPSRVVVLAEDLIWASRLTSLVTSAGAESTHARTEGELDRDLSSAGGVIVDLTARNYDAVAAIERSVAAGRRVICLGPHEDEALRARALAAGAARVYTYNQVHTHGSTLIGRWVAGVLPNQAARE
jgi:hypothetical protein